MVLERPNAGAECNFLALINKHNRFGARLERTLERIVHGVDHDVGAQAQLLLARLRNGNACLARRWLLVADAHRFVVLR